MQFEEKTLKKEYVYNGKILNLRRDEVMLPNGQTAFREIVEHSGGSCVVCEKDGKILLVKQFRYPYKEEIYEIPAGKLNKGESPEQTAIRELNEEGGIKAKKVELLYKTYPSPAYTEEVIYIYKATEIEEGEMHLDSDEFLTCKWFSKDELKEMIKNGLICDGKTLIALLTVLD